MLYANNKGTDQPAHTRSLISAFVVHCLDSIIPLFSMPKISSLYLASVAAQADLSQPSSQTQKTDFLVMRLIYGMLGTNGLITTFEKKISFNFYISQW